MRIARKYVSLLKKSLPKLLIVGFCLFGMFHLLSFKGIENDALKFGFKALIVPYTLVCYAYYFWKKQSIKSTPIYIGGCLFFYLIFAGVGSGYIVYLNKNVGAQETYLVRETILGKTKVKGRYGHYRWYLYISDRNSKDTHKIEVSESEYAGKKSGHAYSEVWYRGSLGLRYR